MREPVTSPTAAAVGPYSHGVDAQGLVFCSGQTPIDPATGVLAEGGVGRRTDQCFDNLFGVLAAAGLTSDDVQKVNVFLTDMDDFDEMNAVYATRFAEPFPSRTTIGVASLPLGSNIEIELIAQRPQVLKTAKATRHA
ncbi:MAG: 2-iminobutanoate/2-iminopropanoate deaminase [Candidatus Aldehydirespiratoraceae bacterium]|jgi:2-iminobutanoate/2-iminopropanoate deaminase